jgi:hypothetical protein
MVVPYTVDLSLLDVAVYPLGDRDCERREDRTVVVYLALHDPGMGVGQDGVEYFPFRAFYHQEHVIEGPVVAYDDRHLGPVCGHTACGRIGRWSSRATTEAPRVEGLQFLVPPQPSRPGREDASSRFYIGHEVTIKGKTLQADQIITEIRE